MEAAHAAWHVGARGGLAKHEMSRRMQPKHADRHVCDAVAPCMSSSHAAWHLGGVVASCMFPGHAASHVEHEVPPCMRPEPCGATHGLPPTWSWLAGVSYKYPTTPAHFFTSRPVQTKLKPWEKSRKRKQVIPSYFESFREFSRSVLYWFRVIALGRFCPTEG